MSLRDEIAQKLFFEEHGTMEQWGREDQYYNPPYYALADALMPLVERAAREAYDAGWNACYESHNGLSVVTPAETVARIMEGGR